MPLIKKCSLKAFQDNIRREIERGTENKQAVAIAFSTLKKACGVETTTELSPKEIVARGESNSKLVPMTQLYLQSIARLLG